MSPLEQRLKSIKQELGTTQLVVVSKSVGVREIDQVYSLGERDFAENRVENLIQKSAALYSLCPGIQWHFIGNLQSNKIKKLMEVSNLQFIHSVDSLELVQKLEPFLKIKSVKFFLQINTSQEAQKQGLISWEQVQEVVNYILSHPLQKSWVGLMTMATYRTENKEVEARRCFKELREMKQKIEITYSLSEPLKLSMGMSEDYKIALEYEANFIRLGSALFT